MYDFAAESRPTLLMSKIIISKDRGRKEFKQETMMELRRSIIENGLCHPIVVTEEFKDGKETGNYILVAGESRYRCYLTITEANGQIPFTLMRNLSPLTQKIIELEENMVRKALTGLEPIFILEQIDTLRRQELGDKSATKPDGWSIKDSANLAGVSTSTASQQINFAKKLRERPDIRKKIEHLPIGVAMKVAAQIEEGEKVERLAKTGKLTLSTEIQHSDALTYLRSLKPDSVDLILTDPPFGLEALSDREGETSTNPKTQSFISQLKPDDNLNPEKAMALINDCLIEFHRVLKPGSHFYIFFSADIATTLIKAINDSGLVYSPPRLIWNKDRSTTPFRGYSFMSCYEDIFFGYKPNESGKCRRLEEAQKSIITVSPDHTTQKTHIFQKPIELLAKLIKFSTFPNQIVCDPFAGSGSTIVAARETGRIGIGCELNREHWSKAQARLVLTESMKLSLEKP